MTTIAEKLRIRRAELGLSQADVAIRMGMFRSQYIKYEKSVAPIIPSIRILRELCAVLGLDEEDMGISTAPKPCLSCEHLYPDELWASLAGACHHCKYGVSSKFEPKEPK